MANQPHFIREWRKFRGMTQEQLAERIGISRPHLSKIEKNARKYDQAFLEAAAQELRATPADLIMRDPTDPEGIWSVWDQIKPLERPRALELLRVIGGGKVAKTATGD